MPSGSEKKPLRANKRLQTVLVFIVAYAVFLFVFFLARDHYGTFVLHTASNIVAVVKDVSFEELSFVREDYIKATFIPDARPNIFVDLTVRISTYMFNAPLTFAFLAALYLHIKRRCRAYGEAAFILFCVHLLYVCSLEALELTKILTKMEIESPSKASVFLYELVWSFTKNMVILFEPFLIGFYTYIRFRDKKQAR